MWYHLRNVSVLAVWIVTEIINDFVLSELEK